VSHNTGTLPPVTPIQRGFKYEVRLYVSIPLAWAQLLKTVSRHHYDYRCRAEGDHGVINGLFNTACDSETPSIYPVTWADLDITAKVAEQLEYHTNDHTLIRAIWTWLRETQNAIMRQHAACMELPGTACTEPSRTTNPEGKSATKVVTATEEALSEEQRHLLIQFQETCRVIGAHDSCAVWAALGCAIEGELAALDLGATREPSNTATMASHEWHRAVLEKYLVRSDAGRGAVGLKEALHALLAAGSPNQTRHEKEISITQVLHEALDKWQSLIEGMRSSKFQPPSDYKLHQDLERIALLRQSLNAAKLGRESSLRAAEEKVRQVREVAIDLRHALQEAIGVAKCLDEQQHFAGRIGGWHDLALRAEKVLQSG